MKKLMMAAAIVCAAAFAQAAQISWGITAEAAGVTAGEGWATEGATYGLYLLSSTSITAADITKIDVTTGELTVKDGTATLLDTHTLTEEEADDGSFAPVYEGKAADLNGKYFAILLTDPTIADNSSVGIYTITGLDDAGGQKVMSIDGTGDATMLTQTGTVFSVENVPEPTSGLLLLIGMAGLALRRRRA